MKKLIQSTKKLSLSSKKSKKKKGEIMPVTPPSPAKQRLLDEYGCPPNVDGIWIPQRLPEEGWTTDSEWSTEAVRSLDAFLEHYASIGIAGIKAEFTKKVQEYKSPTYGDTAFNANPTKNRDKDIMACLDGSRVELEDKQYINASWVFDKARLGKQKYILTQEPLRSTISDFWQMIHQNKAKCIVVFAEREEGWPPKLLPGNPPDCTTIMDKFWPIKKTNGIIVDNLCTKRLMADDQYQYHWWFCEGSMRPVLETRLLTCKGKKHTHNDDEKKFGCRQTSVETFLLFIGKSKWGVAELKSTIYELAMIERNGGWSDGPLVLMDDFSGTSRAAVLTVVDVMGSLMFKGEKSLKLPQVVKWVRCCRNGAIRTEDDYVFIVRSIFYCTKEVYEDGQKDDEESKKRKERNEKQYEKLFGEREK